MFASDRGCKFLFSEHFHKGDDDLIFHYFFTDFSLLQRDSVQELDYHAEVLAIGWVAIDPFQEFEDVAYGIEQYL